MLGSDRNSLQSFSHKQDLLAKKKKKKQSQWKYVSWRLTTANSHLRQRKQDRGRPGQGVWSARPFPWEDRVPGPGRQPRRRRGQDGLPPKRPPLAGGRRLVCLLPLPQQRSSKPDSGTRGKPPRALRRESAVRPAPSLTRTRDRNEGGRPPPLPAVRAAAAG